MILIKYIILGIIQGITEPLPISSSGHLKIIRHIFNDSSLSDMNFEIIVNLGSLIAILYLYKNKIIEIAKDYFLFIKTKNRKYKENFNYGNLIVISTVPAAIFGIKIKDLIETNSSIKTVGFSLIITGFMLYIIKNKDGSKEKISIIDAIKIGLFQVLALFPGISRSGSTVTMGMLCNLKRETSLDYSFMLYIPISIASSLIGIRALFENTPKYLIIPYLISMIVAIITTYWSAKMFINVFKKGKLIYFSIYCIIIGIITFIAL